MTEPMSAEERANWIMSRYSTLGHIKAEIVEHVLAAEIAAGKSARDAHLEEAAVVAEGQETPWAGTMASVAYRTGIRAAALAIRNLKS